MLTDERGRAAWGSSARRRSISRIDAHRYGAGGESRAGPQTQAHPEGRTHIELLTLGALGAIRDCGGRRPSRKNRSCVLFDEAYCSSTTRRRRLRPGRWEQVVRISDRRAWACIYALVPGRRPKEILGSSATAVSTLWREPARDRRGAHGGRKFVDQSKLDVCEGDLAARCRRSARVTLKEQGRIPMPVLWERNKIVCPAALSPLSPQWGVEHPESALFWPCALPVLFFFL